MPTIFSQIIEGTLPARFVWKDERVVAFLTIAPLRPGHALVVPRAEIDHWLDLEPDLAAHLTHVAQWVGRAIDRAFRPKRVALMIAGLEVPHAHLHVLPFERMTDLDPTQVDTSPDPAALDDAARRIREALRALGRAEASD